MPVSFSVHCLSNIGLGVLTGRLMADSPRTLLQPPVRIVAHGLLSIASFMDVVASLGGLLEGLSTLNTVFQCSFSVKISGKFKA